MAHFAELDENNVVLRVIVVKNEDTQTAYGIEKESIGAAHCEKLLGGRWVQTSYNANFRGKFASSGDVYIPDLDIFLNAKPYPSWVLDKETKEWKAPVPLPNLPYDENMPKYVRTVNGEMIEGFITPYQTQLYNLIGKYDWNESIQNWVPWPSKEID